MLDSSSSSNKFPEAPPLSTPPAGHRITTSHSYIPKAYKSVHCCLITIIHRNTEFSPSDLFMMGKSNMHSLAAQKVAKEASLREVLYYIDWFPPLISPSDVKVLLKAFRFLAFTRYKSFSKCCTFLFSYLSILLY